MVAVALRALPQDRSLNVRLGAALLTVGLLLVFFSFSGNQAYDIRFFYVATLGTVVGLYGAVMLAYSRVARTGAKRAAAPSDAPREWVRMQCPACSTVFSEEGARPFTVTCPNCKRAGLVE